MSTPLPPADDAQLREQLRQDLPGIGLEAIDRFRPPALAVPSQRRAGAMRPPIDTIEVLSLLRGADGVLRWDAGTPVGVMANGLRRAGRAALPSGQVIEQFGFTQIAPNQVGVVLRKLDQKLTPSGFAPTAPVTTDVRLRRWQGGQLAPFHGPDAAKKNVLLFVHGTFSNCDNLFTEMAAAPLDAGAKLLAAAEKRYDLILTFDHPTMSFSPVVNAFDLAALLRPAPASVDVVSHSRGGLVTRWFLEGFADPAMKRRAVLVAASIAGTSLAAPPRLKAALSYLANVGDVLGRAAKLGAAHPFLTAAAALASVMTAMTRFAAGTPLLDAAVAMIPGLQGQSKVGNNPDLVRLRANTGGAGLEYYAVQADFQPNDPGWNFLQYFSKPMQRVASLAADLVFDEPNDLVVDTASMTDLADQAAIPPDHVLDYGTTDAVHHTSYFRQERTLAFIRAKLGI